MEELTKTQLILLALLVSFVTSIATGIATVALMDQAPTDVTRVINRVVERTVEKVTPSEQGASVVTKEKTVIVKEEDALTSAIDGISETLVRLYSGIGASRTFLGMGTIVDADGYLITDGDAVVLGGVYEAVLPGGTTLKAEVIGENKNQGVAVLALLPDEDDDLPSLSAIVPTQVEMQLGQTVFTVSGETTRVGAGIVAGLPQGTDGTLSDIQITVPTSEFVTGAPLGNLFGEVVGIARSTNSQRFLPIANVLAVVRAVRVDIDKAATGESETKDL